MNYNHTVTPAKRREWDNAWLQAERDREARKREQEERMWNEHDREGK